MNLFSLYSIKPVYGANVVAVSVGRALQVCFLSTNKSHMNVGYDFYLSLELQPVFERRLKNKFPARISWGDSSSSLEWCKNYINLCLICCCCCYCDLKEVNELLEKNLYSYDFYIFFRRERKTKLIEISNAV